MTAEKQFDNRELVNRLTIKALVSDDDLMERLILKGGNAIWLRSGTAVRRSLDLDFSIAGDFNDAASVGDLIQRLLESTF